VATRPIADLAPGSASPIGDLDEGAPSLIVDPASGAPSPIGPTLGPEGVGFSVYAPHASAVELLLFDAADDDTPARVVRHDRATHRTGPWWHCFVPGIRAGQLYAYRVGGPLAPDHGLRFDERLVLLDPYGRGVAVPAGYRRESGEPVEGHVGRALKSVVVDMAGYDWEGDRPIGRPFRETVIYEAHVRGMTASPSSGVPPRERGTFRGLITRLPYIERLGITAIELLPVFAFDELAAPDGLRNYWGYQPVSFFAPHPAYASGEGAQAAADEFRDLVKACHRAGIEVILDVVYNHTAEVGADGPTFSWRGFANDEYYSQDPDDPSRYIDASGTGNTLDAGEAIVRRMVLDSLRYWVSEMHVDGFRFDLAAALSRGRAGRPTLDAPLIRDIETDPVLAGTKLIAEAWDAGGEYQVGTFAGERWCEWNGRFRDDLRSFLKSDPGYAGALAQRILASPDLYGSRSGPPSRSIDFVTCHDGMTLNDLVTYARKRNEANGEGGRDGTDDDRSWDSGAEGPTDDPDVERLRGRQVRNALAIMFLSLGVPMLLMGDEVRRTQGGNNNAYCHDDETTWFDWSLVERHADLLEFTRKLIAGRRRLATLVSGPADRSLVDALAAADVQWGGVEVGQPDLSDDSRSIALTFHAAGASLHLICNAWWEPLAFGLPAVEGPAAWRRVLDTSLDAPDDLVRFEDAPSVEAESYEAGPRSVVLLAARPAVEPMPGVAPRGGHAG
jgi:glycogen operon protein